MDNVKCGKFIAALRKERGLTQGQLAERIGVTDKAVSKWETGRGFPDVSVLPALAEELGATLTELVNGERSEKSPSQEDVDRAVTAALESVGRTARRCVSALLFIAGAVCILLPAYLVGAGLPFAICGALLILAGVFLRWERLFQAARRLFLRLPGRAAAAAAGALSAAALVCELLPFSAAMRFAAGPYRTYIEYTSYFSLLQTGYGNLLPVLTAGCTVAVIVLSVIRLLNKNGGLSRAAVICAAAGGICSAAMPVLFGAFTAYNLVIAGLLWAGAVISAR